MAPTNVSEVLARVHSIVVPESVQGAPVALYLALAVVFIFLALLVYDSGVLLPVKVQRNQVLGPFLIVYQDVVGPYRHSGKIMCSVVKRFEQMGLVHSSESAKVPMVGVFFDDPALVPADQLRHSVGCVFKMGAELSTPDNVARHRKFLETLTAVKQGHLKVGFIPASRCIAASFPFRSTLSMVTSIIKGYPHLQKALKHDPQAGKEVLGSLEVYLRHERRMWISFPLTARTELRPFDPATTLVHHYTGGKSEKALAAGVAGGAADGGSKKSE